MDVRNKLKEKYMINTPSITETDVAPKRKSLQILVMDFSRPITHIENGIKQFLYIHIAYPLIFVEQNSRFEVARPEKGLNI